MIKSFSPRSELDSNSDGIGKERLSVINLKSKVKLKKEYNKNSKNH